MFHKRAFIVLLLAFSLLLPAHFSTAQGIPAITTTEVMSYVHALSVDIGARPAGSPQETLADDYVAARFEEWGYTVDTQEFETDTNSGTVTSHNVIATREGDDQVVVVGAHVDCVDAGTGAGDNASGVAAILAAAHALANEPVKHTLVFIAFGAEEDGNPMGSEAYIDDYLEGDTSQVIAMLNVDSVGVGTDLNVYAGARVRWPNGEDEPPTLKGGPTWVRDLALGLADEMKLPFGTSPTDTWEGYTGDWGDHYPFVQAGVPIAYFEAWQWQGAKNPWWGEETNQGDVMHTEEDVYENVVPEKVQMAAELVTATADALATGEAQPPAE